jgi:SSS family solute:Na+ symporter
LFNKAPIFFNEVQIKKIEKSAYKDSFNIVKSQYEAIAVQKQQRVVEYAAAKHTGDKAKADASINLLSALQEQSDNLRKKVKYWLDKKIPGGDGNDTNYIFLRFVVDYLPAGLVGLLIAVIFLASWGSIAAAINSLASCSVVDLHRKFSKKQVSAENEYKLSKYYTLGWGIFSVVVAMFTYNIGNSLIEAVNILGSLFYGVILGVFLIAFFFKNIRNSNAVFWGAVLAQLLVLTVFILTKINPPVLKMGFLWLNPIGAFGVIFFTLLINSFSKRENS